MENHDVRVFAAIGDAALEPYFRLRNRMSRKRRLKSGPIATGLLTYEDARRSHERHANDPETLQALKETIADMERRGKAGKTRAVRRRAGPHRQSEA